jgi:hypothetical protein
MPSIPTIDAAVWSQPVTGLNLRPGSLRDQLGSASELLVFLRHFG